MAAALYYVASAFYLILYIFSIGFVIRFRLNSPIWLTQNYIYFVSSWFCLFRFIDMMLIPKSAWWVTIHEPVSDHPHLYLGLMILPIMIYVLLFSLLAEYWMKAYYYVYEERSISKSLLHNMYVILNGVSFFILFVLFCMVRRTNLLSCWKFMTGYVATVLLLLGLQFTYLCVTLHSIVNQVPVHQNILKSSMSRVFHVTFTSSVFLLVYSLLLYISVANESVTTMNSPLLILFMEVTPVTIILVYMKSKSISIFSPNQGESGNVSTNQTEAEAETETRRSTQQETNATQNQQLRAPSSELRIHIEKKEDQILNNLKQPLLE